MLELPERQTFGSVLLYHNFALKVVTKVLSMHNPISRALERERGTKKGKGKQAKSINPEPQGKGGKTQGIEVVGQRPSISISTFFT